MLIGCEQLSEFGSDVGLGIFDMFVFDLSCWWAIVMIRKFMIHKYVHQIYYSGNWRDLQKKKIIICNWYAWKQLDNSLLFFFFILPETDWLHFLLLNSLWPESEHLVSFLSSPQFNFDYLTNDESICTECFISVSLWCESTTKQLEYVHYLSIDLPKYSRLLFLVWSHSYRKWSCDVDCGQSETNVCVVRLENLRKHVYIMPTWVRFCSQHAVGQYEREIVNMENSSMENVEEILCYKHKHADTRAQQLT